MDGESQRYAITSASGGGFNTKLDARRVSLSIRRRQDVLRYTQRWDNLPSRNRRGRQISLKIDNGLCIGSHDYSVRRLEDGGRPSVRGK